MTVSVKKLPRLAALLFLLIACAGPTAQPIPPTAANAPTSVPTSTPEPTRTPEPTATPAPTLTPTPIHAPEPTPTPKPKPKPKPTPEPTPLAEIWEISEDRVFTVAELESQSYLWIDKEPILLSGCRLLIEAPARGQAGGYGLFSQDGKFSQQHYLVYIGGSSSLKGPFQKGECYEMVVVYQSSKQECFFMRGAAPLNPFAPCPTKTARHQQVPSFKVHSELVIQDGKMLKDTRPNARLMPR